MYAQRIREKYPDRYPVILHPAKGCRLPALSMHKYIIPEEMPISRLLIEIRKRISIPPERAIFLFVEGKILPPMQSVAETFEKYRREDGFLHVDYSEENTFG